jgi:hypothetical protein
VIFEQGGQTTEHNGRVELDVELEVELLHGVVQVCPAGRQALLVFKSSIVGHNAVIQVSGHCKGTKSQTSQHCGVNVILGGQITVQTGSGVGSQTSAQRVSHGGRGQDNEQFSPAGIGKVQFVQIGTGEVQFGQFS